jgi:hypothetical protein
MRWGIVVPATAAGLLMALAVAALTDPGVTICVDNFNGGSYCQAQGGPNLALAGAAGVLTALLTALLLRLRRRR